MKRNSVISIPKQHKFQENNLRFIDQTSKLSAMHQIVTAAPHSVSKLAICDFVTRFKSLGCLSLNIVMYVQDALNRNYWSCISLVQPIFGTMFGLVLFGTLISVSWSNCCKFCLIPRHYALPPVLQNPFTYQLAIEYLLIHLSRLLDHAASSVCLSQSAWYIVLSFPTFCV